MTLEDVMKILDPAFDAEDEESDRSLVGYVAAGNGGVHGAVADQDALAYYVIRVAQSVLTVISPAPNFPAPPRETVLRYLHDSLAAGRDQLRDLCDHLDAVMEGRVR